MKPIHALRPFLLTVLAISAWGQAARPDSWKIVGQGGGGTMIGPVISPHNPHLVVEHCDMTGGYITRDDGESWRMFNLRAGFETFAFDPRDRNIIYAANMALWRSRDAGKSWSMIFPDPRKNTVSHEVGDHSEVFLTSRDATYPGAGSISAIATDPRDPQRLYVAFTSRHSTSAVYTSPDRGSSWKQLARIPQRALLLTFSGGSLAAVTSSGLFRVSSNGEVGELGHLDGIVAATAAQTAKTTSIYATTQQGKVFAFESGSHNWREVTPVLGQTAGKFQAIAASEYHAMVAYVGFRGLQLGDGNQNRFNGIAKTVDAGTTWVIVFKESTRPAQNLEATWIEQRATQDGVSIWFDAPYSLGVAPTDPDICYATDLFRTYRTLNGGKTWKEVNSKRVSGDQWTTRGLDVTTNYGVQFDPFNPNHMFIDYTDVGLFQSQNGGTSWQSSTEGVPEDWRNTTYWLALDPAVKGLIWGAFSGVHDLPRPKMWRGRDPQAYTGGVGISTDGGRHWSPSSRGMPSTSVTHILIDSASPAGKRTLYATAFGRGVYKSVDNGASWALRNNGIAQSQPFAWRLTQAREGTLYLVVARAADGKNPTGKGAGALYRSTDRAEHWVQVNLPSGVDGPTGLTLDPRTPQRLYLTAWGREGIDADSGGGVFLSTDAGQTWAPRFQISQHVYDLTVDPRNPDVLYITGFDAAAYRSPDAGAHWSKIPGYDFKWGHRVIPDPTDVTKIYISTYGGGLWHGTATGGDDALTGCRALVSTTVAIARTNQQPPDSLRCRDQGRN